MSESCQLYRHGSLGQTLVDTIDELVVAQKMDPQQAKTVLQNFDEILLRGLPRPQPGKRIKMSIKAALPTYGLCDDYWTFKLKGAVITMDDGEVVQAEKMKIFAYSLDPNQRRRKVART
jgi:hypothetical protein